MTAPSYMAIARARGEAIPKPVVPSPDELRAWREREGLTQDEAARVAGVTRVSWARYESGPVPQWLRDTLAYRWGSAP